MPTSFVSRRWVSRCLSAHSSFPFGDPLLISLARHPPKGHTQELKRHFSMLSLIGLASTTTISWTGLGLGLITEIGAGGPGAVIYGFILVTFLQCFLGASLAEFVSSYPTSGGMYHWIAAVAPRKWTGILSFFTGWFSVLGCKRPHMDTEASPN